MLNVTRSCDRLIFNMGMHIPEKEGLDYATGPRPREFLRLDVLRLSEQRSGLVCILFALECISALVILQMAILQSFCLNTYINRNIKTYIQKSLYIHHHSSKGLAKCPCFSLSVDMVYSLLYYLTNDIASFSFGPTTTNTSQCIVELLANGSVAFIHKLCSLFLSGLKPVTLLQFLCWRA